MAEGKHFKKPPEPEAATPHTEVVAPQQVQPGQQITLEEDKGHHVVPVVLGCLVGAVALLYLGGALFFSRFFLPNTTLNGRDVSLTSCWSIAEGISKDTTDYSLAVSGDGVNFKVESSDIGITTDADGIADHVMAEQNPWRWPLEITDSHSLSYEPNAAYDPGLLASVVSPVIEEANQQVTASQNAYVAPNADGTRFEIVPEVYGSAVDAAKVIQACGDAIADLEPSLTLDTRFQEQPEVLSDDERLIQQLNAANGIVDASVDLTMGGGLLATISGADMVQWVTLTPEGFGVSFDDEGFRAWAKDEFSTKYDTAGNERTYIRPDGKEITVSGGTYGWVIDSNALIEQLLGFIKAGSTEPLEVPTKQQGEVYAGLGQKDWGNSWIDVDISEQYVRYYDEANALVWESPCVTGDSVQAHDTPTGVYFIQELIRNTVLVGQTDPKTGEPEYRSHVDYWMPFRTYNWGLHDASWRSSFGGTIYQGNGSHGCVNLPVDAAESLFNQIHEGTVVVSHY